MIRACESASGPFALVPMVNTVEQFAKLISDNADEEDWTDVILELNSLYCREYATSKYNHAGSNRSARPLAWLLNRSWDARGVSRVGRQSKILEHHDARNHL